jgi:hypothetical protein
MLLFLLFLLLETCEMTNSNAAVASAVPRVTISPAELLMRLSDLKGAKIVTLTMRTSVSMLKKSRADKTPCPFGEVSKRSVCQVMLGTDYEKGVNNRRDKEGSDRDFQVAEHQWATRCEKPVLSQNAAGTQTYVNVRVLKTLEVNYFEDGNPIDKEDLDLANYGPKRSESSRQGVDDQIIWRMPKIFPECSIESYKSDGVEVLIGV